MAKEVKGSSMVLCQLLSACFLINIIQSGAVRDREMGIAGRLRAVESRRLRHIHIVPRRFLRSTAGRQQYCRQAYSYESFFTQFALRHFDFRYFVISTFRYFEISMFQLFPLCPNPPAPRSVSSNVSVGSHSTCSWRATTICAIRSPSLMVKGSEERFTRMTHTSPR